MNYYCEITECHAQLLGFHYFGLTLDDGKSIAVCPSCMKKIRKMRPDLKTVNGES